MQKTENYTGIANGSDQDRAVQETMGPIVDRTTEHLGTSDTAVIAARRTLIRQARDLESGREPAPAWNPAAFRLRSLSCELPSAYTIEQANTAFQARQPSPIA
jgi:hypothetical protein